ncbi:MAG: J domain-containing protein [Planctomycetes bacterium]|nr:J domain-containing protein [Planctomycetota bacterium]
MLMCWACEQRFTPKLVERDSLLKSRAASEGGPYRLYNCPRCLRTSKVEVTPQGRWFASPPGDFSVMDYFFGWLDLLSPRDFLYVVRWNQKYADLRQEFFERDGDDRYSKTTIAGAIRSLFSSRTDPADLEVEEWRQRRQAEIERSEVRGPSGARDGAESKEERRREEPPRPEERPAALPHPHRILGVAVDASSAEIRAAFKKLVRTHHPDKLADRSPATIEEANRRLQELIAAYEELTRDGR